MTDSARLFLTGPKVLERAVGETVSMEQLGGPAVHRANGVCQLSVNDEAAAIDRVRHLLDLLPHRFGARARVADAVAPQLADPGLTVPSDPRRVYDVRHTVAALADSGSALETCDRWGQGMYTGIARLAGRTVGIVANQTRRLGGVIDAEAAEKASVFVRDCDRFGLPLIVLVDTPGFMPGLKQEKCGVIRHGASLLKAFAGAEVPKLTVVLRKAFGGAAITMNSRDLGADVVFAWPGAEIGIMSASQAVGIVSRRELESVGDDDRKQIAERYAERHLTATAAAANGFVDEVIEPDQTRSSLVWALATIDGLP
jgi:acetyl-CoA carboxylase carboxyltransferase component